MTRSVLYLGVDEAGYGPRVGPLCVGASLFSLDRAEADGGPDGPSLVDFWSRLAHGVCRASERDGRRVVVDDSKRVLRRKAGKADTTGLELGVRAFLSLAGDPVDSWDEILSSLRCALGGDAGPDATPELTHSRSRIGIMTNPIRRCASEAGVRCLGVRCTCLEAHELNARVDELGTKSSASFACVCDHLERAFEIERPLIAVIDRQGGRTSYQRVLHDRFPWMGVEEISRSDERSVYRLTQHNGPTCWVEFRTRAEDVSLPVALGSMAAKLVREMRMSQFNAYWCDRIPELKPTAGYGVDGRRWIQDVAEIISNEELSRIVRVR